MKPRTTAIAALTAGVALAVGLARGYLVKSQILTVNSGDGQNRNFQFLRKC